MQIYSTVNSIHSDQKTLNYSKCSQECHLFGGFSTQINLRHMFKVYAVGTIACFES